jgi:peptidoglycan L-alanyl-D-glutamate endopeptidase CwlK
MINSRLISDLDPQAAIICQRHIELCAAADIEMIVTSTWRDIEAQDALYRVGREPGDLRRRVTNAKGGQSWHNYRVAWDVVPLIGGKAIWNDPIAWKQIIAFGEAAGAEAGANWKTFPDQPHFQYKPHGLEMADAFALFATKGTIFV